MLLFVILISTFIFFKMLTYSNPENEFLKIDGTILSFVIEKKEIFKGGVQTQVKVRYKYEYLNNTYVAERITCDANGRLFAHSSKPNEMDFVYRFASQVEKSKSIVVLIRANFPSRACLLIGNSYSRD